MLGLFRVTTNLALALPFMLLPMGLYILAGQFTAPDSLLYASTLPSGAAVGLTAGGSLILVGIACLMAETVKATHTGLRAMIDHVLSLGLFVAALIAFLLLPQFGTMTWGFLMALQFADVLLGAVIGIRTARRDIGLNA